jgi:surface antigen
MNRTVSMLLFALSLPAFGLQRDIPYANFTDKDREIFQEALDGALDKDADGRDRSWSNPATKAHGNLKALRSFEREGLPCRTLTISNSAKGRSASGPFTFCKQPAGQWKLVPTESPKPSSPRKGAS